MKKIVPILLIILIIFAGGCKKLKKEEPKKTEAVVQKEELKQPEAVVQKDINTNADREVEHQEEELNKLKAVKADTKDSELDSDGDGVPDYMDEEPNTPRGVKVDAKGRALDSDGDKIADYLDQEPTVDISKTVKTKGSQNLKIIDNIKKNSDELTPEMKNILDGVAEVLKKNKKMKIIITGHACDLGTEKYNMRLSHKRATAVEKYLEIKQIDKKRMTIDYKGESMPAVPNISEENRSQNRRVEVLFYNDINKISKKNNKQR